MGDFSSFDSTLCRHKYPQPSLVLYRPKHPQPSIVSFAKGERWERGTMTSDETHEFVNEAGQWCGMSLTIIKHRDDGCSIRDQSCDLMVGVA